MKLKNDYNSNSCIQELIKVVQEKKCLLQKGDKILIYCQTIENIKLVTENLACGQYYKKMPDKDQILYNFINNAETKLLTCSTALCAGFDYHSIWYVFHYLFHLSFLNFVQESGKAGRD